MNCDRGGYLAATGTALHTESPAYAVHNLQVTKPVRFGGRLAQVYASVDNLFDYRQPGPLVGVEDGVRASAPRSTRSTCTARSRGGG